MNTSEIMRAPLDRDEKPIARRSQFVNTAVLMERLGKLPPIDYEQFRADIDAFVDQDPTPRW